MPEKIKLSKEEKEQIKDALNKTYHYQGGDIWQLIEQENIKSRKQRLITIAEIVTDAHNPVVHGGLKREIYEKCLGKGILIPIAKKLFKEEV